MLTCGNLKFMSHFQYEKKRGKVYRILKNVYSQYVSVVSLSIVSCFNLEFFLPIFELFELFFYLRFMPIATNNKNIKIMRKFSSFSRFVFYITILGNNNNNYMYRVGVIYDSLIWTVKMDKDDSVSLRRRRLYVVFHIHIDAHFIVPFSTSLAIAQSPVPFSFVTSNSLSFLQIFYDFLWQHQKFSPSLGRGLHTNARCSYLNWIPFTIVFSFFEFLVGYKNESVKKEESKNL